MSDEAEQTAPGAEQAEPGTAQPAAEQEPAAAQAPSAQEAAGELVSVDAAGTAEVVGAVAVEELVAVDPAGAAEVVGAVAVAVEPDAADEAGAAASDPAELADEALAQTAEARPRRRTSPRPRRLRRPAPRRPRRPWRRRPRRWPRPRSPQCSAMSTPGSAPWRRRPRRMPRRSPRPRWTPPSPRPTPRWRRPRPSRPQRRAQSRLQRRPQSRRLSPLPSCGRACGAGRAGRDRRSHRRVGPGRRRRLGLRAHRRGREADRLLGGRHPAEGLAFYQTKFDGLKAQGGAAGEAAARAPRGHQGRGDLDRQAARGAGRAARHRRPGRPELAGWTSCRRWPTSAAPSGARPGPSSRSRPRRRRSGSSPRPSPGGLDRAWKVGRRAAAHPGGRVEGRGPARPQDRRRAVARFAPPAPPSPSGARPTSPSSTPSATRCAPARSRWSSRPKSWPARRSTTDRLGRHRQPLPRPDGPWRKAGHAQREVEDKLWVRFRTAQDTFFAARNADLDKRDAGFRDNLAKKQELAAEAKPLAPAVTALKRQVRAAPDPGALGGRRPGAAQRQEPRIEGALRDVERAVADGEQAEWKRTNPEARARAENTVRQLGGLDRQVREGAGAGRGGRAAAQGRGGAGRPGGSPRVAGAGADRAGGVHPVVVRK